MAPTWGFWHIGSSSTNSGEQRDYVTMSIGDQMFGIPVLTVQDVLGTAEHRPRAA
jgi:chemotaxis signal transduction protein